MKPWIRFFTAAVFCVCGFSGYAEEKPITGKSAAGCESLDKAILDFMTHIDASAATVTVSRGGRMIYSRGFGWSDQNKTKPVEPNALMRIASISKPFTAAIIRELINAKKLSLEDKAFSIVSIRPADGKIADPRILGITIDQLLEHKGGWDSEQSFDPMFRTEQIKKELHLERKVAPEDVIQYMLSRPLQFAPGEKTAYSNFGYCVLGRIIEKVTGQSYEQAIHRKICGLLGIKDIRLAQDDLSKRDPREVEYPQAAQTFSIEVMDSHGGLIASTPALCRFLKTYWISGQKRLPGQREQWTFFGSLPGTTAMVRQREDGVIVAVLMNNRRKSQYTEDNKTLKKAVDEAIDSIFSKKK